MGQKINCYYFTFDSGRCPVRDFIDELDTKSQTKFFFVEGLLEEFGHRLPQPHAKYLGDHIFELRFFGVGCSIRVLYFFYDEDKAIFTNGFIKKTNKTPMNEKRIAIERRAMFLSKAQK